MTKTTMETTPMDTTGPESKPLEARFVSLAGSACMRTTVRARLFVPATRPGDQALVLYGESGSSPGRQCRGTSPCGCLHAEARIVAQAIRLAMVGALDMFPARSGVLDVDCCPCSGCAQLIAECQLVGTVRWERWSPTGRKTRDRVEPIEPILMRAGVTPVAQVEGLAARLKAEAGSASADEPRAAGLDGRPLRRKCRWLSRDARNSRLDLHAMPPDWNPRTGVWTSGSPQGSISVDAFWSLGFFHEPEPGTCFELLPHTWDEGLGLSSRPTITDVTEQRKERGGRGRAW